MAVTPESRMREFYRAYENSPALLGEIGWTQNVLILESGLTMAEMGWYIRAAHSFGWTKKHLIDAMSAEEHLLPLDCLQSSCYTEKDDKIQLFEDKRIRAAWDEEKNE